MLGLDSGAIFIDFYSFFLFCDTPLMQFLYQLRMCWVLVSSFSTFRLVIVVVCAPSFVGALGASFIV